MSILIHQVSLDGKKQDIYIEGNRIAAVAERLNVSAEQVIDGRDFIAIPGFYNTHAHAAMSLLRGYADNLELMDWLTNHIWPAEARLTPESIYWGTKLACLEMIKSGIMCFCDMYFSPARCIQAVEEMGMRAVMGMTTLEGSPNAAVIARDNEELWANRDKVPETVQLAVAPHAIYTVCGETLAKLADFARENNILYTIHVAETEGEVEDCKRKHSGMTPVAYLDSLGVLGENVISAHTVHVTEDDCRILARRKVHVANNPCSNFKLLSGLMPYRKLKDAGVNVCIGTDGNASNNNLSMFDEMKAAAIMAELAEKRVTACNAEEIFASATVCGARAMRLDAGLIEAGRLADLSLLDAHSPCLVPCHNLKSNLVYSADTSCVNTVICNGKVIMANHHVPGENEIMDKAAEQLTNG